MALPTFNTTWKPEEGASKQKQPRVKAVSFGDGYEQRTADGINNSLETWSVTFKNSPTIITAIDDFLNARNALEAFNWINPEGNSIAVVCSSWARSWDNYGWHTLQAEFKQKPEK